MACKVLRVILEDLTAVDGIDTGLTQGKGSILFDIRYQLLVIQSERLRSRAEPDSPRFHSRRGGHPY